MFYVSDCPTAFTGTHKYEHIKLIMSSIPCYAHETWTVSEYTEMILGTSEWKILGTVFGSIQVNTHCTMLQ
jgi:hypothetical protein